MLRTELVEVPVYKKIIRIYSDKKKEIPCPIVNKDEFYVYMLECFDSSLYVGFSDDVEKRISRHKRGDGAEYTRKRLPIKLIYCEVFRERIEGLKRERQLKGWSKRKKIDLICK